MSTQKKPFTLRIQETNFKKIQQIAQANKRSISAEIELIIELRIKDFEKQNGKIKIPN